MTIKRSTKRVLIALVATASLGTGIFYLYPTRDAKAATSGPSLSLNKRPVPNIDVNLTAPVQRVASAAQLQAASQSVGLPKKRVT